MSFLNQVLFAIVTALNPAVGFMASIVEFITSSSKNAGKIFVAKLFSSTLPGGFVTNLASDIILDIYESNDIENVSEKVVPFNNIVQFCSSCDKSTHYYIYKKNRLLCSRCLGNDLKKYITHDSQVYLLENNVYRISNKLELANKTLENKTLDNRILPNRII